MVNATRTLYRGTHPADVGLYSLRDVARYVRLPAARSWPHGLGAADDNHSAAFTFRALVNVFLLGPGLRWWAPAGPGLPGLLLTFDNGSGMLVSPEGDMQPLGASVADEPTGADTFKSRVTFDGDTPVRLYPFTRPRADIDAPRLIALDPRYSFGNPIIAGHNLRTDVVAGRFRAGESVAALVEDLGITAAEVEEAIRYEAGFGA